MEAELLPFPLTPAGPVDEIRIEMARKGLALWLRFIVEGDPNKIAWPSEKTAGREDGLWQTTCFEAFVSTDDGYCEFNMSPSGQWASYRFDGYRAGMRNAEEVATVLGMDAGFDYSALEARIELPLGATRLALSAVIEGRDGVISYWALAHPSPFPDFHHAQSFVLDLPAPEHP